MPLITRHGGGDFTTDPAIAVRTGTHGTDLGPGSYPVTKKYDAEPALRASNLTWHSNAQKMMPSTDYNYDVRLELDEAPAHVARTGPAGMSFNASKSSFSATGNRLGAWIYGGVFVASTKKDNPDPGAYKPKVDHHGTPDTFQELQKHQQGNQVVPLLGSSQSAPAIPPPRDPSTFRYTGRKTDTLAPCDYDQDGMANPSTVARKTVRTTNFAASDSERRLLPPTTSIDYTLPDPANPDPGDYKVRSKLTRGTEAGFRSTMPRLATTRDQDFPGPGHYPIKGMAGTWPPPESGGAEPEPLKMSSGMASTSDRPPPSWWRPTGRGPPQSTPEYLKMPGPGGFEDPKAFGKDAFKLRHRARNSGNDVVGRHFHAVHEPKLMSNLRNSNGAQVCGFNSSSLRDAQKPVVKDKYSAGPGDYDLDGAMGCSIMAKVKSKENVGKKGAFGSCADRYEGSAFKVKKGESPDPGAYSLPECTQSTEPSPKYQGAATEKGQGPFKSTQVQRPVAEKVGNVHTGPGQYELIPFPGKINYRNPHRPGRTAHVAFGMAHDRWDPNAYHTIGPDPGNYSLPSSFGSKGLAISTDHKTAPVRRDNDVGPGTYEVRKSLLKQTFNVAQKAHARRSISKAELLDLPLAGGGAGGGNAGTHARMSRAADGGMMAQEEPAKKPAARKQPAPGWRPPQGAAPRPALAAPASVDPSVTAASFYSGAAEGDFADDLPPIAPPPEAAAAAPAASPAAATSDAGQAQPAAKPAAAQDAPAVAAPEAAASPETAPAPAPAPAVPEPDPAPEAAAS